MAQAASLAESRTVGTAEIIFSLGGVSGAVSHGFAFKVHGLNRQDRKLRSQSFEIREFISIFAAPSCAGVTFINLLTSDCIAKTFPLWKKTNL